MNTDKLLSGLDQIGWETRLTPRSIERIASMPLRGDSFQLAAIAAELAVDCQPITLRGLFYRVVSTGFFPSTDDRYYKKFGSLMTTLRREGLIPYEWIVDNLRATIKPSSWSGLTAFADTVRDAYRKDFWASLDEYVRVFTEKDAMAGVIEPVTTELDVALSPLRGYVSDSFAHQIGSEFRQIDKPIVALYIGDYDPSGFDIPRSFQEKLEQHSGKMIVRGGIGHITWRRLALVESDFDEYDLFELKPKKTDSRYRQFVEEHGGRCAEVDALDPNVIRQRVRDAIMESVDQDRWKELQRIEAIERESWESTLGTLPSETD